jgi:hypothetical protein
VMFIALALAASQSATIAPNNTQRIDMGLALGIDGVGASA